jgi:hypothetical protein
MKRVLPIFLTFFVLTFVFSEKAFAACTDTNNPEFHSLRPYPADPCQSSVDNYAKFCGNDLTLHETITETYPGDGSCTTANGTITCTYQKTIDEPITIDLSIASLPIMGNTEDVINSKNASESAETLDDAAKVNNYVSWYLNGVNYRAEYGNTKTDADSLINFSGPIQKLLPTIILDAQRIQTFNNAKDTNHNQIVVCGKSDVPIVGDFLKIGNITPTECYSGNGSKANNVVFRLKCSGAFGTCIGGDDSWEGDLSFWNSGINALVDVFTSILPGVAKDTIRTSLGDHWNLRIPPLPWSDKNGKPFASDILYQKAYNEWRGETCVLIPVINHLVCLNNFLIPNKYANLYPYVPLSGTEDLKGKVSVDSVSSATNPASGGVTVQSVTFLGQKPATLFFAHMQESDTLANLLQSTFVAKGQDQVGSPTDVASGTSCNTVEVRTNKGDNLFANQIAGNLHYNAAFSCDFKPAPPDNSDCMKKCLDEGNPTSYCGSKCSSPGSFKIPTQSCSKDVYISLSTTSSTPKVDDIWSRLVAGPMSVFKMIFPKTNTTGGIGQIMDIPASTNITYSAPGVTQASADIKFPHIGGISEYFLKGIQTMLRPKGYGEPISFAPVTSTGPACKSNGTDIDKAISDASAKYGVPAKLLYAIFQMEDGSKFLQNPEGYVCEENGAGAAGVMQIIPGTYKMVTCEDERLENSLACSESGKLSRCVLHDAFELAARTLMWHAGVWPTGGCTPLGKFPSNKQDIYNAVCKYYGSSSPDAITIHAAQQFGLPDPNNKNYCDVVCYLAGNCP